MKQPNHTPAALEEVCGRAEAANAAAVAGLRRLVGTGASREQLGRAAETLRRMEAQVSSLKYDLAGRLQRTDGWAGAGEALRDQFGDDQLWGQAPAREAKHQKTPLAPP